MNRQIELRSYNKELKKFFYFKNGRYYKDPEYKNCISERICSEFIWSNSERFTGLLDKNGNKIWEGDIIQQQCFNGLEFTAIFEVIYNLGSFCIRLHKGNEKAEKNALCTFSFEIYSEDKNKLRKGFIIGNIHDNPELLKNQIK